MRTAFGMDASWKGLGWCAATEQGPIACGLAKLDRTWRWPAVRQFLDEVVAEEVAELSMLRRADDPPPFLAIEKPPPVYSTPEGRGDKSRAGFAAGNQAATGYGMGLLSGAIQLWWDGRGGLGYPWEVEVSEWRRWWKITGKGRSAMKSSAIRMVGMMGWAERLAPFPEDGLDFAPRADVAEAILIAVGAARHGVQSPVGPARRYPPEPKPVKQTTAARRKKPWSPDP